MRLRRSTAVTKYVSLPQQPARRGFSVTQKGKDVPLDSLYKILGLGNSAADNTHRPRVELNQAFLRRARELHPDTNPKDAKELERMVQCLQYLNNSSVRSRYDCHHSSSVDAKLHVLVEGGEHSQNFNPEHKAVDFSCFGQDNEQRSFGDYRQAFRDTTNTPAPDAAKVFDPLQSTKAVAGAHIEFVLRLSFDEAMLGCTKSIRYRRNAVCRRCAGEGTTETSRRRCPQCNGDGSYNLPSGTYLLKRQCDFCNGSGVMPPRRCGACSGSCVAPAEHTFNVFVPAGTISSTSLRFRAKGHDGLRGGSSGDLIVSTFVEEHRVFHRIGNDLHIILPVPLTVSLLGGFIDVPTLRGLKQLHVPPGVKSGEILSLHDEGMPCKQTGTTRGSLRIHCVVVIPKGETLSGRQKASLEVFGEGTIDETPESMKAKFASWMPSNASAGGD
jgi:DnaJ-class molecular chaperone